ncbi:MAG: hypothetical protein PHR44_05490 [Candidatus Omnitrophica bacterium]|nr:hypothetical protein [Candidatus Omnitrophota bacterium]
MVCDAQFNKFKLRRDLWVECFALNDRNSIIHQVYQMIWNAAVFRLINCARKIAPDNHQGNKEINGTLHYFIDECFFDSQFLAIRRLIDPHPLTGKKGAFSLVSLLNDMRAKTSLMTRRYLFLAEDREYDYEAVEQRASAYRLEKLRSGSGAFFLPRELDSQLLRMRHEQIDALSGIKENQRTPNDYIRKEIFSYLIKKIKSATDDIKAHVDKNIAHAATPESRKYDNADQVSITLGYLWKAHKVICQVVDFINVYILFGGSGGFLPVPQYDHLEFIDKPLVSPEGVEILDKEWNEFNKEADSWGSWGIEDLEREMVSM